MADNNFKAIIDELKKRAPEPSSRAPYGKWVPFAWYVRELVESGHGVMDSVRTIVKEMKIKPEEQATIGIRQAYYAVRHKPKPKDLA